MGVAGLHYVFIGDNSKNQLERCAECRFKDCNGIKIGEATLSKEAVFADLKGVGKVYYFSVPKNAPYFISVVTNGASGQEYDVITDDRKFVEGKIKLEDGWQASFVMDQSSISAPQAIRFSKGEHTISIIGKGPEVPFIEHIRIAENQIDA
jgi:hypothetical protein